MKKNKLNFRNECHFYEQLIQKLTVVMNKKEIISHEKTLKSIIDFTESVDILNNFILKRRKDFELMNRMGLLNFYKECDSDKCLEQLKFKKEYKCCK